jgi:hypothetical protein
MLSRDNLHTLASTAQGGDETGVNGKTLRAKREALDTQLGNVLPDDPWESVRTCLRERLDLHIYQTWLVPVRYVRIDGSQLILAAPTDEFLAVAMRFEEDILTELDTLNLPIDSVVFVTLQELIEQSVAN